MKSASIILDHSLVVSVTGCFGEHVTTAYPDTKYTKGLSKKFIFSATLTPRILKIFVKKCHMKNPIYF